MRRPLEGVSEPVAALLRRLVAPGDAYHQAHLRRIARTVELVIDAAPPGRLLELGTGGVIPLALRELRPDIEVHVTQFDLALPPVGAAHVSMGDLAADFPAYRLNLEEQALPVEDGLFDVILCCEVLEHMEVDPMFMLAEVNRVTAQDGVLVLTTPNITSTRAVYKVLRGQDPYFYMQYRKDASLYRHNYEYSVVSLTQTLESAGFRGKIWTEDTFQDPVMTDIERLRPLGYELANIGDNIFAVVLRRGPVTNRYPNLTYAD